VAANTVNFTALDRDDDCYFYRDFGASHFGGDYEHLQQILVSAYNTVAGQGGLVYTHVLANDIDDWKGLDDANKSALGFWWYGLTDLNANLRELDSGMAYTDTSVNLVLSTVYYIEIERDEGVGDHGTIYAYICTGDYWDDGGVQIDTLAVALHTSKKDFRYLYCINNLNSAGSDRDITGYIETLDTQEVGVSPPTLVTNASSNVEETTATASGNITVTSENCTVWGFEYGTYSGGVYTDNATDSGSRGVGLFTKAISGLTEGIAYIIRAIAYNSGGWGYASDNDTILTKPLAPTSFTATAGYQQVVLGWTKGTGSDNTTVVAKLGSYPANRADGTVVYSNTGTSHTHTGLGNGESWYYRAWGYATEAGLEQYSDAYGQDNATTYSAPTVTTGSASGVTDNDATLNGNITDDGGATCNVTWYWDTTDYGQTENWTYSYTQTGQSAGAISYTITDNLTPSTLYYFNIKVTNVVGAGWGNSANFTTTPPITDIFPPTGLTLTDLGAITVNAEWAKGVNSTYTMLRVSRTDYPSNITEGELFYYGDGVTANSTGYSLDTNTYFVTAWGFGSDNITYSNSYVTASIGGDGMENLATAFGVFNGILAVWPTYFLIGFGLLVIIGLSLLAFWKLNALPFMLAAGASFIFGLCFYDAFTTNMGLTIGLMMIAYSVVCLAFAIRCILWREKKAEE